jgi:hypothetical protein
MQMTVRGMVLVVAAGIVSGRFSTPLLAQTPRSFALRPGQCATCVIRFDKEVTLGDLEGPGSFTQYSVALARDSRGRYVVIDGNAPVPLLFDSAGRFIAPIARRGQGPGEITRAMQALFGPGDTIVVAERNSISIFAPNQRFVRKVETRAIGSIYMMLPNGNILYHGTLGTPAGVGFQYHILSTNGDVVRSFVESPPPAARGADRSASSVGTVVRWHALSKSPGQFWSLTHLDYRFTLNDSLGVPVRVWEGSPAWFAEEKQKGDDPRIAGVREDSRRILWVIGRTRVPGWRDRLPKPDASGNLIVTGNPFADTHGVLDAIDLETGAIITSARIPSAVLGFVDDERIAVLTETSSGIARTEIRRFSLVGYTR